MIRSVGKPHVATGGRGQQRPTPFGTRGGALSRAGGLCRGDGATIKNLGAIAGAGLGPFGPQPLGTGDRGKAPAYRDFRAQWLCQREAGRCAPDCRGSARDARLAGFSGDRNRWRAPPAPSPPNTGRGAHYAHRNRFVPRFWARLRRGSRTRRRPRTLRPPPRFWEGRTLGLDDARQSLRALAGIGAVPVVTGCAARARVALGSWGKPSRLLATLDVEVVRGLP
jgi:hypothetical protein